MALIASISIVLLVAWFCYACRLILFGGEQRNCLAPLEEFSAEQYYEPADEVQLHNDYMLASYLLRNAGELQSEGQAIVEHWMIHIYYSVVRVSLLLSPWKQSRVADWLKTEMALIVHFRMDSVGESRNFVNS